MPSAIFDGLPTRSQYNFFCIPGAYIEDVLHCDLPSEGGHQNQIRSQVVVRINFDSLRTARFLSRQHLLTKGEAV